MNAKDLTKSIISIGDLGLTSELSIAESMLVYEQANQLMTLCLEQIPIQLPNSASIGVQVARKYWFEKLGTSDELESALMSCLYSLEKDMADVQPQTREHFAIRAVMCVLHGDFEKYYYGLGVQCFSNYLWAAFDGDADSTQFSERIAKVVDSFFAG